MPGRTPPCIKCAGNNSLRIEIRRNVLATLPLQFRITLQSGRFCSTGNVPEPRKRQGRGASDRCYFVYLGGRDGPNRRPRATRSRLGFVGASGGGCCLCRNNTGINVRVATDRSGMDDDLRAICAFAACNSSARTLRHLRIRRQRYSSAVRPPRMAVNCSSVKGTLERRSRGISMNRASFDMDTFRGRSG